MFSLDILRGELANRHPQLIPSHMPHIWPLCYTNQIKLYCTLTRFWRKQILGTLWNQVEPWNCWRQNSDKNAVFTQNLLSCFSFNVSCIIPRVCLPPDIQLQPLLNCLWWLVIWTRWKRPVSIHGNAHEWHFMMLTEFQWRNGFLGGLALETRGKKGI